ncbi:helix-turn-helix domain-containing protein [Lacrimispora aerotolerans]|uniref:helix-turn-helix domain-containing protein n=1 Tax=Lacrimispora aerotolerans TaxID=36832 RepID=UPI00047ED1D9|nr:helix-turn-helix domain-containing protein [Lacrimispora aerotolerans]
MAESRRKTPIDERKDIVRYCIDHNRDYKGTATKYDVSYSRVYNWVRDDGLMDKRGCHKANNEVDELEKNSAGRTNG